MSWARILTTDVAYDEEDGDFKFTRGSKRTKTVEAPAPAAKAEAVATNSSQQASSHEEVKPRPKRGAPRKMDFSTPQQPKEPAPKKGTRKSTRRSTDGAGGNGELGINGKSHIDLDGDSIDMVGGSEIEGNSKISMEGSREAVQIALPFSDTPVINRNKELRKKAPTGRRSSLGMRGRRASSLIDNGHTAIPHREVGTTEFYKHIEADGLSEPRRMKQLLTWCAERALGDKPSHNSEDNAARLAGKHISGGLEKPPTKPWQHASYKKSCSRTSRIGLNCPTGSIEKNPSEQMP